MVLLAWSAGVLGRLVRASVLLTLPIAISVVLVSVFTRAGTTVLFTIGPFDATVEGVDFAAAGPRPPLRDLDVDRAVHPDHRPAGLRPRPRAARRVRRGSRSSPWRPSRPCRRLVERAAVIGESQRARGLDTEGSLLARIRGFLPLIGPVIIDVPHRRRGTQPRPRVAGVQPARPAPSPLGDAGPRLGTRGALGPRRCPRRGPRSCG